MSRKSSVREDGSVGVGLGILGLGVIGSQVARVVLQQAQRIAQQVGAPVVIRCAAEVDVAKLQAQKAVFEKFFKTLWPARMA